ncbi:MAG: capsule assembly Wzi family protein [bacterium]
MLLLFILSIYFPIDSWQSEFIEELQVRGLYFTKFPGVRPYTDLEFDSSSIIDEDFDRLWLSNFSLKVKFDTIRVARFKPMVNYNFYDFSLYLQPDVKFGTDSLPPNKVFKNLFSADYERVYARYENKIFSAFIGRERFSIGPSPRYNMLLSGYGPPLDWFHYSLTARKIRLSYYLSQLDDIICKPFEYVGDTITTLINARRYLIIKRLDISPVQWFNCSFSEGATFGGENYALTPYHFNPLVFIHTLQHNWGKDANLFFHLDSRIFLKNFSIYSALLVDDYQLEPDPNKEPNHFGINLGIEFADLLLPNSFAIIEYHYLSRWIYCIYAPYQRYMYYRHPIGFPYGPDCDELYVKYVYHFNNSIDLCVSGSYLRKGETNVNTPWPIPENPRVPGTSFPDNNFLSGIVENTVNINLGIRYFYGKILFYEANIGLIDIQNYHHSSSESKKSLQCNMHIDFLRL